MAGESETDTLLPKLQSRPRLNTSSTATISSPPTTTNATPSTHPSGSQKQSWRHTTNVSRVILSIFSILLITDFAGYAAFAPQLSIYESVICEQYYTRTANSRTPTFSTVNYSNDHGSQKRDCKILPVQSELALINGWADMFPQIPGIILAIPYGALADHIGRKPVLMLGMFGCILSEAWIRIVCFFAPAIPLRAVWFSASTVLIGGGPQTVWSLMWVMIADVCTPEIRTIAFSHFEAVVLIPEILAIPISASLMSSSSWLPFAISFVLYIIGFLLTLWLPETLPEILNTDLGFVDEMAPLQNSLTEEEHDNKQTAKKRFYAEALKLQESLHAIRRKRSVVLVLSCFFLTCLGRQAVPLILQYAPKRFHWTIAQTSYLMSIRGSITLILLLVLLPAVSEFLSKRMGMDVAVKDKWITQGSLLLCLIGSLLLFLATSPLLFVTGFIIPALGASYRISARSLLTSLVDQNLVGTVYTATAAITSAGILTAGPLMAYTFRWGLHLDGIWLGMPFLIAACLYGLGLVLLLLTNVTR